MSGSHGLEVEGAQSSAVRDELLVDRPSAGPSAGPSTGLRVALLVLLFAVSFVLYLPTRDFDFVDFDDNIYVSDNPHLRKGLGPEGLRFAFTSLHSSQWQPIAWLSHLADYELWGLDDPGGHHLSSNVIHAATAVLLALALAALTRAFWASLFVAALFALHPLRVESVAWVAERKDVLCGFFWAASLLAYARYVARPGALRYAVLVVAFALCLGAKSMGITLPFVLLLLDRWPLERTRTTSWARLVLEKTPLFALSAALAIATYHAQDPARTIPSIEVLTFGDRAANALLSYTTYLGKIAWPIDLACFYPHPRLVDPDFSPFDVRVLAAAGVLVVISALALGFGRKRPWLTVGWLWFLGTLVPVIGLVQSGEQALADRFVYLPSIGITIAVVWGVCDLARRSGLVRVVTVAAGVLVLIALAFASHRAIPFWRNSETLFARALDVTERNYVALVNWGKFADEAGRVDEAERAYRDALAIQPKNPTALGNLGKIHHMRNELPEAESFYSRALEQNPRLVSAKSNLGVLYMGRRKFETAIRLFEEALAIRPEHVPTLRNLVLIYFHLGNHAAAIPYLETLVVVGPRNVEFLSQLATALAVTGRATDAVGFQERALEAAPDDQRAAMQAQLDWIRAMLPRE